MRFWSVSACNHILKSVQYINKNNAEKIAELIEHFESIKNINIFTKLFRFK